MAEWMAGLAGGAALACPYDREPTEVWQFLVGARGFERPTPVHAWRAAKNRVFAGKSWEIYGDWSDDPAKLETTIVYLLK